MQNYNYLDPNYVLEQLKKEEEKLGKRIASYITWNESDAGQPIPLSTSKPSPTTFNMAFCDFEAGLALLAGKPNHGKSSVVVSLIHNVLKLNKDTMVLDFSFDDSTGKRFQQHVAHLSGLEYQQITMQQSDQAVNKTKAEAISQLYRYIGEKRLFIYDDLLKDKSFENLVRFNKVSNIKLLIREARRQFPDRKLLVFIDAWNDIDLSEYTKSFNEIQQQKEGINELRSIANANDTIIFMNAHLRKGTTTKVDYEALKGSGDLTFAPLWIGILNNEKREEILEDPLLYTSGGRELPVLVIEQPKNKISNNSRPIFLVLDEARCSAKLIDDHSYYNYYTQYRDKNRK
jgi:hypothetical protein